MKRIILIIFIFFISIIINTGNVFADQSGNQEKNNFIDNIKIEETISENNIDKESSNLSNEDIFGDEQTFPFVAGFGKNATN